MATNATTGDRIYIEELAAQLRPARAVHTIRRWVNDGLLPDHLRPQREGGRGRLYWLEHQFDEIQEFAHERESRRGWSHLHRSQGEST